MGSGGRMDCCGQCVKYSMFVANFIIFIGGAIVFGLGVFTLVDKNFVNELLGTNLFSGAVYVLIATSALVCLLSFFGCMGAAKEYKCMLLTYFILVFLIFVTMLIGGILGYVFREKVSQTMGDEMRSSMSLYGGRRSITQAWDTTQERLKCCGVESFNDWRGDIPRSCCQQTLDGYKPCNESPSKENIHTNGCLHIASNYIRDNAAIIGGSGIAVAVLLVFGMIFSCSLFRMIE
ncbi:tetraspanin-18 [Anopheles darlingi]|uniref:Tetraspanin n=1 Tax=Anopheles darlingi TaxID=43151 RepID=W5JPZ8_ANODA|nr:CD151 antigen-like [Anopheles darlingi]XP_049544676.1 CD151 antigen-like [Anopheles darlingi]XP_049544677.1 CD151 antigen-like [Anopheles darlingi]ETN66467.1 tetraspanin-18 [Anopheles darlingi]